MLMSTGISGLTMQSFFHATLYFLLSTHFEDSRIPPPQIAKIRRLASLCLSVQRMSACLYVTTVEQPLKEF
jgi:hypothetical protein